MLIAFFADIHANRQAFIACLTQARDRGAERVVLLGDYVGYGGDPDWVTTAVMDLVSEGAVAVRGNHDHAINSPDTRMNIDAQVAIEWTRGVLDSGQRAFLAGLPYAIDEHDRLYVHSEASQPDKWIYVQSTMEAATSLAATSARITFCGHIHQPALYSASATGKLTSFTPKTDVAIPLLAGRQWLAVLGSVGQPRDGNPMASYTLLDTEKSEITYCRAAYDIDAAAASIMAKRLPTWLAERLYMGR